LAREKVIKESEKL